MPKLAVEGLKVTYGPIVGTDGRAAGALLVSERMAPHGPVHGNQRELARIGAWLAGVIQIDLVLVLAGTVDRQAPEETRLRSIGGAHDRLHVDGVRGQRLKRPVIVILLLSRRHAGQRHFGVAAERSEVAVQRDYRTAVAVTDILTQRAIQALIF